MITDTLKIFSSFLLFVICCVSGVAHAVPEIQHWQTKNGARVLFVEMDNLPMLDIRVVFDAGSARDGKLPGLAALTNSLLAEGAGGQSAQQLAERFESVGAILSNDSLRDMAYVGVRSLTEQRYLDTALSALQSVITQPDFADKSFQRELSRMKVALEARKQSPSDIASEAFFRAIYQDHPYADPPGGTEQSLNTITLENIKNFYRRHYVASNAVVAIVGAVNKKQAKAIVNKIVSDLPVGKKPDPIPQVPRLEKQKVVNIPYPSQQSHIYIGQPGISRGDPDYYTLYVANHPFGGSGFASRLVEIVREQKGLAYSVYSYFSPMREAGPFIMSMQTRTDQTEQAVDLLMNELQSYVANGPQPDELSASVSNITGSFPLKFDSNSKLLGYIAMIGFYDLPEDYLDDFNKNIRNVSLDEINRALKARLHPDRMVTVIVGNHAQ